MVLSLIRGQNAESAINCLQFSNRRISNEIKKVLKAAIANAENNHQLDIDKLFVYEAFAGKAMVMKRFRPRARGRSGKILKPYSNIKIVLKEREVDTSEKSTKNNKKVVETKQNNDSRTYINSSHTQYLLGPSSSQYSRKHNQYIYKQQQVKQYNLTVQ